MLEKNKASKNGCLSKARDEMQTQSITMSKTKQLIIFFRYQSIVQILKNIAVQIQCIVFKGDYFLEDGE